MLGAGRLRRFDLGNKAIEGIFDRSLIGAIVTIASVTLMAVLVISELVAYIKVDTASHMTVSDFHEHDAISIRLRATFPHITCEDLEVVADNTRGGSKNSGAIKVDRRPAKPSERKRFQRKSGILGCTLEGTVEVERAAGSLVLHVIHHDPARMVIVGGLGVRTKGESRSGSHGVAGPNITHIIHDFNFGSSDLVRESQTPLSGSTFVADQGSGIAKYSLKVVPISHRRVHGGEVKSHTYSANVGFIPETQLIAGNLVLGVEFAYDFSPVMVRYTDTRKSLFELITSVCAIVGGVHTVSGLFVRGVQGAWRKKMD